MTITINGAEISLRYTMRTLDKAEAAVNSTDSAYGKMCAQVWAAALKAKPDLSLDAVLDRFDEDPEGLAAAIKHCQEDAGRINAAFVPLMPKENEILGQSK